MIALTMTVINLIGYEVKPGATVLSDRSARRPCQKRGCARFGAAVHQEFNGRVLIAIQKCSLRLT
jgi:hypothetical protein